MNNDLPKKMLFHHAKKTKHKSLSIDPISNVIRTSMISKMEGIHKRIEKINIKNSFSCLIGISKKGRPPIKFDSLIESKKRTPLTSGTPTQTFYQRRTTKTDKFIKHSTPVLKKLSNS
jgi:hypothetical protein